MRRDEATEPVGNRRPNLPAEVLGESRRSNPKKLKEETS